MSKPKFDHILTKEILLREYVGNGKSAQAIGEQFGIKTVTVLGYLQRYGIERRPWGVHKRKYSQQINVSGFVNITDDWHAYWLGFIAADGSIENYSKTPCLRIKLAAKDVALLHDFLSGTNASNPVYSGTGDGYPYVSIHISSSPLVTALSSWGITPRKTFSLQWPDKLSPDLIPAYIRGFFDGDGTIYIRRRSRKGISNITIDWIEANCRFISGSVPFLEKMKSVLHSYGIVTRKIYRNQQSNAFILAVSSERENVLAFRDLIYKDSSICLERKRQIFQEVDDYHGNHPRGVVCDYPRGPRKSNAPDGYYTARDAAKRLGMPDTTFRNYVNTGRVSKYVPSGYKHGFYPQEEIDQLARKRGKL